MTDVQHRTCKASIRSIIESKREPITEPISYPVWLKKMTVLFKQFDKENAAILDAKVKK